MRWTASEHELETCAMNAGCLGRHQGTFHRYYERSGNEGRKSTRKIRVSGQKNTEGWAGGSGLECEKHCQSAGVPCKIGNSCNDLATEEGYFSAIPKRSLKST